MKLDATLYTKHSSEAVDFYLEAFGMSLGYHVKHSDGSYLHAELEKDGNYVFAVSEMDDEHIREAMLAAERPTMSYGLDFSDEDELRKAYARLADGGHVLRPLSTLPWSDLAADVVDRYGVCWYITLPQHRPADE